MCSQFAHIHEYNRKKWTSIIRFKLVKMHDIIKTKQQQLRESMKHRENL